jgi:hypothetical protein
MLAQKARAQRGDGAAFPAAGGLDRDVALHVQAVHAGVRVLFVVLQLAGWALVPAVRASAGAAGAHRDPNLSPARAFGMTGRNDMEDDSMPAKSKAQQKAAGAALSAKRGETRKSELKGASRSMVDSMTEKELEEMASTKRKGKPEHAAKK